MNTYGQYSTLSPVIPIINCAELEYDVTVVSVSGEKLAPEYYICTVIGRQINLIRYEISLDRSDFRYGLSIATLNG